LIFEDRKFADIGLCIKTQSKGIIITEIYTGNTASLQYSSGMHKIASWAHIVNANSVPGPSIIAGLAKVGLPLGRGLLLLAEMSTEGSLARGAFTDATVRMARGNRDFVIGFIAMHRMDGVSSAHGDDVSDEDFLILTPGVSLDAKGDFMGQQYRTPREVILESGCDVMIVGRGIYGTSDANEIATKARRYQEEGWKSYLERIGQ
jgi:orotidine-5'-phosphate decarboxylase